MSPIGYQVIGSKPLATSAQSLTIPAGAKIAWIQGQTENIRYLFGSVPKAATGLVMYPTDPPVEFECLDTLKFIAESSGAFLTAQYFG